jgi:DNA repair protein SbcC/Rad50
VAPTIAPQAADPFPVWVDAICATTDRQQALAWLAQLQDEASLAEVAMRARGGETRIAAAQRIASSPMLEHVAQHSRDKDKRVYRHCADLLKQRQLADRHAARAQAIADELRHLLDTPPLPNTRLLELGKELDSLPDAGAAGSACADLLQQARAQLHRESEALRDLQAQARTAAGMALACRQAAWPWHAFVEDCRLQLQAWRQAAAGLPAWLGEQAVARRWQASLDEIETGLDALSADSQRGLACEAFLAECEAADAAGIIPAPERAVAWAALEKPTHAALRAAFDARWRALAVAPAPLQEPEITVVASAPASRPAQARIDQAAVRGSLAQLERAIAEGHLVDADAAAKQLKTQIGSARLPEALATRLHSLQAELETLRGWARWGTAQAREKMIEAAQALLTGERDIEALARSISGLREEWKRLNAHAAAGKAQWESFNAALEQAYLPVAAHRAAQAELQAAAKVARETMCDGWEAELAGLDWAQADFKAVEAKRTDWVKQWRAAPQAGFRDERALRKRFDGLIAQIDSRLEAARAAELQRREQLIVAAEALAEQGDLRLALNQAKTLQQHWTQPLVSVRLQRGDEQKQWQRFRAACNAVFARLDAQRAEQQALRLADAEARQQAQAARRQQEQARLDRQRSQIELLARKAALVQRVEAAAISGVMLEAVLAEANQVWQELDRLPAAQEQALSRRLAQAHRVSESELAAGAAQRDAILLDLEIGLDLPSPEQCAEMRRERQLSRLRHRFDAGQSDGFDAQALLLACYATPAAASAISEQRLSAVARRLQERDPAEA